VALRYAIQNVVSKGFLAELPSIGGSDAEELKPEDGLHFSTRPWAEWERIELADPASWEVVPVNVPMESDKVQVEECVDG
jgi:hypothetical protein